MRWLCLTLFMLAIGSLAGADSAVFPDDPLLDKPVTLAVKGEALSDVLAALESQTRVRLRANRDVADQKATIFVDDEPLRNVMEGLRVLFRYTWSAKKYDGKTRYELWESEKTRRERVGNWERVMADAWDRVRSRIDLAAQDQGKDRLGAISREYAKACQSLSPEVVAAIQGGCRARYNSETDEDNWRLPAEFVTAASAILSTMPSPSTDMQFESVSLVLSLPGESNTTGIQGELAFLRNKANGELMPVKRVALGGFNAIVEGFAEKESHLPPISKDAAFLAKFVNLKGSDLIKESSIPASVAQEADSACPVNRSDILALIHRQLGIEIVSDHYTEYLSLRVGKRKVEDILRRDLDTPAWQGWDGKYLYLRSRYAREADAAEVPNRFLRQWKEARDNQGWLGIDELAQIASMPMPKVRKFLETSPYLGLDTPAWSAGPRVLPALRLYSVLDPIQRTQALSDGTPVASFTPGQWRALSEMLEKPAPRRFDAVGLYDASGRRIDKPQRLGPMYPATVQIRELADVLTYRQADTGRKYVQVKKGVPIEDLVKYLPADADTDSVVVQRKLGIVISGVFADGSKDEVPICMHVLSEPYAKGKTTGS